MDLKTKNGSAVKKRPEMALYKPGMGKILAKKGDNETLGLSQLFVSIFLYLLLLFIDLIVFILNSMFR